LGEEFEEKVREIFEDKVGINFFEGNFGGKLLMSGRDGGAWEFLMGNFRGRFSFFKS